MRTRERCAAPRPVVRRLTALALVAVLTAASQASAGEFILPRPAADAIKAFFPKARITGVGRERERGAWYYEVTMREGDRRFEAEVSDEGVIGEVESVVHFSDVPEPLQQTIRQRVGDGRLRGVEKHERHGIARSGRFVPLKTPRLLYEVKYVTAAGERREFQVVSNEVLELPEAVVKTIQATFPGATITEAEAETDDGVMVFSVNLKTADGTAYAGFSRQGQLLEKEVPGRWEDAPAALVRALDAEARHGDARLLLKRETAASVDDGKIVEHHETAYVVRLTRGDRMRELVFDGRGRLTSKSEWVPAGSEDDDDAAEDDDDDRRPRRK